jgi:CRP/FNR family transcriptional regulator
MGVFCELEHSLLDNANEKKKCNTYKKGDTIFYEENHPMGLFCVFNGKAKVFKTNDQGKEQIVRLAKEGDVLGYRALISGEPYNASAVALEDCRICFIPQNAFLGFLKESKNLFVQITSLLSNDLKSAENQMASLSQKSVRERVADTLLMLRTFYGVENDGKTLKSNLSREDLANIVGTATESLIRMLSEFKNEGLIDLNNKKITIVNLEKLKKVAHQFN